MCLSECSEPSNLDTVLKRLAEAGTVPVLANIVAGKVGAPTPRSRIYIVGTDEQQGTKNPDQLQMLYKEVMTAMEAVPRTHAQDWILAEDDPQIHQWLNSWHSEQPGKKNADKFRWWPSDYSIFLKEHGYDGVDACLEAARTSTPFGAIQAAFLDKLTPRETVCLAWAFLTAAPATLSQPGRIHVWDIYHSLHRIASQLDRCPAILPQSVLWLHIPGEMGEVAVSRPLVPPEVWAAQGLYFKEMGLNMTPRVEKKLVGKDIPLGHYTFRDMVDLAGNAFHGFAVNTSMILMYLAWNSQQ